MKDNSSMHDVCYYGLGASGDASFPILNLSRIPRGIAPQVWADALISSYAHTYGLFERGRALFGEVLYKLYEEAGAFVPAEKDNGYNLSATVTLAKIRNEMESRMEKAETEDLKEAYERLVNKLAPFARAYSIECQRYGSEYGMGINDIKLGSKVTIIDTWGIESQFAEFLRDIIAKGIELTAAQDGKNVFIEKSNNVLIIR